MLVGWGYSQRARKRKKAAARMAALAALAADAAPKPVEGDGAVVA
jgi:hypothetical protein